MRKRLVDGDADAWQRQGIAGQMVRHLQRLARDAGIDTFTAVMHVDNRPAIGLLRKLFPAASWRLADGLLMAEAPLLLDRGTHI